MLTAEPHRCRMGNLDVPSAAYFLPVEIMCTITAVEKNQILDEIVAARRSYRQFRTEVPPEDQIRAIIHAGLLAPFAAAAVGGSGTKYFRQFFVFRKGSKSLAAAAPLVMDAVSDMADSLKREMDKDPALKSGAGTFAQRLDMIMSYGVVPGVGTAPYYLVVAERRGFPAVEKQSLAHCLENMWLKATALGLGLEPGDVVIDTNGTGMLATITVYAPGTVVASTISVRRSSPNASAAARSILHRFPSMSATLGLSWATSTLMCRPFYAL
jgi:nitroreductase